jgi:diacylglycerol kinase family enzyme
VSKGARARHVLSGRRALALLSLLSLAVALGLLVWFTVSDPAALVIAVLSLIAAAGCAGYAITRGGLKRRLGQIGSVTFVLVAILGTTLVGLGAGRFLLQLLALATCSALYVALARKAVRRTDKVRNVFVRQHRPDRPVVIMNPKSGGGKVVQFGLFEEARRRGVEAILFEGGDLAELAQAAVRGGADCLGMAGGDGSQAVVAEVAARNSLPFVCIPAGTRNHLALDLGIDRGDPRKAMDAFTKGFITRIDYGLVGGQVFVNNVALGAYAHIVHEEGYRDSKFVTTTALLPDLMTPEGKPADLHFTDPDGDEHTGVDVLMVSNNPYQMRSITGFGQRPRLDTGKLGVAVLTVESGMSVAAIVALAATGNPHLHSGFKEWTATSFRVTSSSRIRAGVDGEAMEFDSPLEFEIRHRGLPVLLPPGAGVGKYLPTNTVKSLVEVLARDPDAPVEDTGRHRTVSNPPS